MNKSQDDAGEESRGTIAGRAATVLDNKPAAASPGAEPGKEKDVDGD